MYRLRALRRCFTCIAIFAILHAAVAPALAQALSGAAGGASLQMPVCTTKPAATGTGQQPDGNAAHLKHCPSCLLHATVMGLPPPAWGAASMPAATAALYPALFFTAPRPLFTWSPARPRAPPSLQ